MENLLEYKVVIYLNNAKAEEQAEKYRDLGIQIPEEEQEVEEKIVKYSFNISGEIVEIRETFVKYLSEWLPAICVSFTTKEGTFIDTPPLLVTYEEFKRNLNEHNKKNTQVK